MFRFTVYFLAFLFVSGSAGAEILKRTVSANKSSNVSAQAVYSKGTCHGGELPQMKVTKKPSHGRVKFNKTTFKLSKAAGKCAGKRVKGINIIYTPNKGYRGKDEFKIGFSFFKYDGGIRRSFRSSKFLITVK
jgi:hypothetical protein